MSESCRRSRLSPLAVHAVCLGLIGSAAGACSGRKAAKTQGDDAAVAVVADGPPAPLIDAGTTALGPYERIRSRFERDCPRELEGKRGPRGSALYFQMSGRSCDRALLDIRPGAPADIERYVFLSYKSEEANASYDTVVTPISKLGITYAWKTSARPRECDHVVEEAVAYVQDLTGLTDRHAAQLAATMRAHPWKAATWSKVHLADQDFYFQYFDDSAREPGCSAGFSQPYLILPSGANLIEEVDVAVTEDAAQGGSDAP